MSIIPGTEKKIKCDTLLLSLGLIPENELAKNNGIDIDENTGGPIVDQYFSTSFSGVFACGNCLHVYDNVDILSIDAKKCGIYVSNFIFKIDSLKNQKKEGSIRIKSGNGIRYVVPHNFNKAGNFQIMFRVNKPYDRSKLIVTSHNEIFLKKKLRWVKPSNIIRLQIKITNKMINNLSELEVAIVEN
jgi:hypothetical protein